MPRRLARLLVLLGVSVSVAVPARPDPPVETPASAAVLAHHPMLRSSIERISAGSGLWRDAVRTLTGSGRKVMLLTPDQVRVEDGAGEPSRFDPETVAKAYPVAMATSQVFTVLVVVNIPLLGRIYHSQPELSPAVVQHDLDRIVIHEVYGHAFPYLLAGDLSGRCPDAAPGQSATDACAIKRENAVRAELQLGVRQDAGVSGLALINRSMLRPTRASGWLR